MIRRTASEILHDLEMRVARLERQSVRKTDLMPERAYTWFKRRVEPHDFHGKTWEEFEAARPDLQKDILYVKKVITLEQKMEPVIESRGWKKGLNGVWMRDGVEVKYIMGNDVKQTLNMLDGFDRARELVDNYVSGRDFFSTGSFPAPYPASKYYAALRRYSLKSSSITDYFKDLLESKGGTTDPLR